MAELPMTFGAVKQTGRRPPPKPEVVAPVDCAQLSSGQRL